EADGLARHPRRCVDRDGRVPLYSGHEPVPASVHGAHHLLRPSVVTHDSPHRLDATRQGRLADEAVAPDVVEKLGLRDHPVAVREQIEEEVEDLWFDRDRFPRAPDLEPLGVDLDVLEDEPHAISLSRARLRRDVCPNCRDQRALTTASPAFLQARACHGAHDRVMAAATLRYARTAQAAATGARDMAPLLGGLVPFGMAIGVAIAASPLDHAVGWATGPVLFSGGSQLTANELLGS